MRRVLACAGAAVVGVLASVVLVDGPASAHVTVSSANAVAGGYAKITFRVPNEKDSADTTKLEVTLPADKPIASVSTKPVPGWTMQADRTKLATPIKREGGDITEAITKLTWTAAPDAAIRPGQFQEFDVSVGPLPQTDQLVFKALQTYSDGDIVRWIDEPAADGAEVDHPAPTLKLTAKNAAPSTATAAVAVAATKDDDARSRAGLGVGVGIAALLVAVLGVALGAVSLRRRPRPTT